MDLTRDVLGSKRRCRSLGRREVQIGDRARGLAVHLFGPGRGDIAAAQSRFDMADRNASEIAREARHQGRHRVPVNQHAIRSLGIEHGTQLRQRSRSHLVERLARLHQIAIDIGHDAREVQHLIEHFAVLCGDRDTDVYTSVHPQAVDHRRHLDRFRPGAEDYQHTGPSHAWCRTHAGGRIEAARHNRPCSMKWPIASCSWRAVGDSAPSTGPMSSP